MHKESLRENHKLFVQRGIIKHPPNHNKLVLFANGTVRTGELKENCGMTIEIWFLSWDFLHKCSLMLEVLFMYIWLLQKKIICFNALYTLKWCFFYILFFLGCKTLCTIYLHLWTCFKWYKSYNTESHGKTCKVFPVSIIFFAETKMSDVYTIFRACAQRWRERTILLLAIRSSAATGRTIPSTKWNLEM